MTRTPQWQLDRQPPRRQTPPTEMQTKPCSKCRVTVLVCDVGPGVVQLSTRTEPSDGWRWNPHVREWEITYTTTPPNGWPTYSLHECRVTPQEKAEAS